MLVDTASRNYRRCNVDCVFRGAGMLTAVIVVSLHLGGDVGAMGNSIADMPENSVRIEGICASSCTMLMARGCVSPSARLGFHSASVHNGPYTTDWWNAIIASHYPPQIAKWFLEGPSKSSRVVWISGVDAIKMGAVACQ